MINLKVDLIFPHNQRQQYQDLMIIKTAMLVKINEKFRFYLRQKTVSIQMCSECVL